MSDELVHRGPTALYSDSDAGWAEPGVGVPITPTSPLERPVAALRRYKWLALAVVLLAIGGGVAATRFVTPQYEVRAAILISSDSPMEDRSGPIRSSGLLSSDDWTQLLKSGSVTDAVVRRLRLYLRPADYAHDNVLFSDFALAEQFVPGQYELVVDQTNKRWSLVALSGGNAVDAGTQADSVGRRQGFRWLPPAWLFNSTGTRKVRFTVSTPREVSARLVTRLGTQRQAESNFLRLTLQDANPQLAAAILNTWAREYVSVAASLKRRKLVDFTGTLEDQLRTAKTGLDAAEIQLSSFRVNTITQPSEGGPIAAGVQETRDPVIKNYFDKKIEYDDIKHDVGLLQSLVAAGRDSIPNEALQQVRAVATSAPVSLDLRAAMTELRTAEGNLATARVGYTDEHPVVKNLAGQVKTLKRDRIPQLARALLAVLRARASDDSVRIAGASTNLQQIPQRTIEEERLRRLRDIASTLYTNLQNRYSEAQLAEASASPDVRVLDSAVAPLLPTKNTTPGLILISVVAGLAAALGLVIVLDKVDPRLRYLSQVSSDLGLSVAGTIPAFPKGGMRAPSTENTFQLIESFRSLRMHVMQGIEHGSVAVAVSSPSPGEGKSLISANLAMSFAEAGFRTILVDGDTRRGALQEMFDIPQSPGLTDFLAGAATLSQAIRPTTQDSLQVMPCGTRMSRSPELLTTSQLPRLVAELRQLFEVVIVDTPPLAAGTDGYSLAASTGALLLVLRVGQTQRRMAAEKLRLVERLPIAVLGAVLNGVQLHGEYSYYSYLPDYEAHDEPTASPLVRSSS
ncbi:MAG: putative exopolysaccharide biosynthesis protein [Gemmatimonadetes bacterium]|nr:putative exopolysaccharide biosynthesis protein [Gemmatimonadota bacterium]